VSNKPNIACDTVPGLSEILAHGKVERAGHGSSSQSYTVSSVEARSSCSTGASETEGSCPADSRTNQ